MKRGRPMGVTNRKEREPIAWEYKSCSLDEANHWGKEGWVAFAATTGDYGRTVLHMKRGLKS
jgi:hypothetical protein